MLGVMGAAEVSAGHVSAVGWTVAILLLMFVIQPLAILGHELGHALAVSLLAGRSSLVVVGRGPFVRVKADPTTVLFSVLPTRGVPFSGVCRFDPAGISWRAIVWIALAGPLATLCELVGVAAVAPLMWDTGAVMRLVIIQTAAILILHLAINLWPDRAAAAGGKQPSFVRDGPKARLAYAHHRAGTPVTALKGQAISAGRAASASAPGTPRR